MEEEDSYSYFSKILLLCSLGSQFAMVPEACFQNGSFQEFPEQKVCPTMFQGSISDQLNSPIERVKPLVPKFDEPYKKVKIEDNLTESEVKTEESEGVNSTDYQKCSIPVIEPTREETVFQLEKKFTISSKISQVQDTLCHNSFQNEITSKEDVCAIKKEEFDVVPVKAKMRLETFVVSRKNWGKRDLKKFRKFQEFYKTYQEKLNIDSLLVSDKFQQISTIAIPKLSTHFKSKPFEAVCAAILLYACREVNYPITLRQILSIADSKDKLINKCVFSLQEILPWNTETKHFKAGEFIKLLTDKLKVNDSVRIAANKIWENIEELGLVKGTHAMTLAACCVKFACSLSNADKSFDTLAIAAETTKTTLKSVYRELFPYRFKFITKDCKLGDPKKLKAL